jgi:hypothetical protein
MYDLHTHGRPRLLSLLRIWQIGAPRDDLDIWLAQAIGGWRKLGAHVSAHHRQCSAAEFGIYGATASTGTTMVQCHAWPSSAL